MQKSKGENRYKICRETAGLTQWEASEVLHISVRTMSDYETGHTRVPDDIVAAMSEEYNAPLLAWWHLKETSVLGRFLPDFMEPATHGDMMFQFILADDGLAPAIEDMKQIMADGRVDENEQDSFRASIAQIRTVKGRLISALAYAIPSKVPPGNTAVSENLRGKHKNRSLLKII